MKHSSFTEVLGAGEKRFPRVCVCVCVGFSELL